MTLYHGSPMGGLTQLMPFLSEHNKSYIYFSTNPVVALLYAVKPVPKPFSFYPYGFGNNGEVVYSEYFKNAFETIYNVLFHVLLFVLFLLHYENHEDIRQDKRLHAVLPH